MEILNRIKRFILLLIIVIMSLSLSGCAIIGTALSAAAAYGIYKVLD